MNKIAAIDVDLTVVDLGQMWLDWLNAMTHKKLTLEDCRLPDGGINYNLGSYFEDDLRKLSITPTCYFRQSGIYDQAKPIEGSQEALYWLKQNGYDIVFVSHCKGSHMKSKVNFLKRYFPFDGFVATKQKGYVRADLVIDDRNEHLNSFNDSVFKVKRKTEYNQYEELRKVNYQFNNWDDFTEDFGFIKEVV